MAKKEKRMTPEEYCARIDWLRENDDDFIDESEHDEDYIPPGCRACGGEYPRCKASSPLFDERYFQGGSQGPLFIWSQNPHFL